MRYLKIASDKNPITDFIELNDFNGFFCTQFQTLGVSRELNFLAIQNRNINVGNKHKFKKYSLTIEILTKYSLYEAKYNELITFIDRNKKNGFRLYYRPYDGMDLRYCLCDIESLTKINKMEPVTLTLTQNSLWLGQEKKYTTSQTEETQGNIFAFSDSDISGYYSASFKLDENISNYYCLIFYNGITSKATITNNSYNEIPLNIRIYGECLNPELLIYEKNGNEPIRRLQIFAKVEKDYYIEINSDIINNGVWLVNNTTKERTDYTDLINYNYGSPYIYINHGDYEIKIQDEGQNQCLCDIFFQEECSDNETIIIL